MQVLGQILKHQRAIKPQGRRLLVRDSLDIGQPHVSGAGQFASDFLSDGCGSPRPDGENERKPRPILPLLAQIPFVDVCFLNGIDGAITNQQNRI